MNVTSIFDLIPNCPNPAPANVVPYFDGCNRTLISIPEDCMSCQDVLACITNAPGFLGTLLTSLNNSIIINGNDIEVDVTWLQWAITVSLVWCNLTVGSTTVNLCSILSTVAIYIRDAVGTTQTINDGDTINFIGLDGMVVTVTPTDTVNIGLPLLRQHMQVLTRDDVNQVAFRNNNQCCAQTLAFDCETNILSISGTNSVDLTCINTDAQTLFLNGNILGITVLVDGVYINWPTVDLSNVNNHYLTVQGTRETDVEICIYNSIDVLQNCVTLPHPEVSTCDDVMACPGIVNMLADQVALLNRLIALENQVQILQGQLP